MKWNGEREKHHGYSYRLHLQETRSTSHQGCPEMQSPDSEGSGHLLSLAVCCWLDINDLFLIFKKLLNMVTVVHASGLKKFQQCKGFVKDQRFCSSCLSPLLLSGDFTSLNLFYNFIYFWLSWVCWWVGFSLVVASGGSPLVVRHGP